MPESAASPAAPRPAAPALAEPTLQRVGDTVVEAYLPPLVPPAEQGSLADLPFDNAEPAPEEAVLGRKQPDGTWRDVTAASSRVQVTDVAKGLVAAGLVPGDRVAIMARTTYEWTLLDFAAWAAGLVTVPIFPTSSAFQTRQILHDAGVRSCGVEDVELARLVSGIPGGTAAIWSSCGSWTPARRAGWPTPDGTCPTPRSRSAVRCWPRTSWPPSSTPRAPRAAPRAACSRTATSSPRSTTRSNSSTRSSSRCGACRPRPCSSCRCPTSSADGRRSAACAPGSGSATRRASAPRTCWPTWRPSGPRSCWPSPTCWRRSSTPPAPRRRGCAGVVLRPRGAARRALR